MSEEEAYIYRMTFSEDLTKKETLKLLRSGRHRTLQAGELCVPSFRRMGYAMMSTTYSELRRQGM